MKKLETLGTVHTHTHTHTIHLENVWQVFVMPRKANKVETQRYTHKCVKNVENYLAKATLVDKKNMQIGMLV